MKREIKFRLWDTEEKKMYSYNLFEIMYQWCEKHLQIPEDYAGQYTGLKDKNGVEIYEGDVIKSPYHSPSMYLIDFIEGGFCATNPKIEGYPIDINHFYPSVGCDIEVIGNIHEHPHLIN